MSAVINNANIVDFNGANATDSFNFKIKLTGKTNNDGKKDNFEIMAPLKYLRNFWRTLQMSLIQSYFDLFCKLIIVYTWCILTFKIKDAKLYVPGVTWPT